MRRLPAQCQKNPGFLGDGRDRCFPKLRRWREHQAFDAVENPFGDCLRLKSGRRQGPDLDIAGTCHQASRITGKPPCPIIDLGAHAGRLDKAAQHKIGAHRVKSCAGGAYARRFRNGDGDNLPLGFQALRALINQTGTELVQEKHPGHQQGEADHVEKHNSPAKGIGG